MAGNNVLGVYGMFNVIRNNYIHYENWSSDHGNRNIYLAGYPVSSGWNLIEGNRIGYSGIPPANYRASGLALTAQCNIFRYNRFYHNNLSRTRASAWPMRELFRISEHMSHSRRQCTKSTKEQDNGYIEYKEFTE